MITNELIKPPPFDAKLEKKKKKSQQLLRDGKS